jgi:hypothetical protein
LRNEILHKPLPINRNSDKDASPYRLRSPLGTHPDNRETNVSAPKNKKNAPADESANQKAKRKKQKLIRLDDLIPKKDVKGGQQYLFGATDTIPPEEKQK